MLKTFLGGKDVIHFGSPSGGPFLMHKIWILQKIYIESFA